MAQLFNQKKKESSFDLLRIYFDENQLWKTIEDPLEVLTKIIAEIRPQNPFKTEKVDLTPFIEFFKENVEIRISFSEYVNTLLSQKRLSKILTDAGILQDVDFLFEVKKRIFAKFLPYQPESDTLEYILNQVFYLDTDPIWLNKIPLKQVVTIFDLAGFDTIYKSIEPQTVFFEVLISMTILSQRMSGRALESDVIKMVPEYIRHENPFAAFEKELFLIENRIKTQDKHYVTSDDMSFRQLEVLYIQCEEFVNKAFQNSSKFGITLRVNQNLLRIRQQLHRLKVLLPLLTVDSPEMLKMNSIQLAYKLIKYNCTRNNVRTFIKESTQLLSYEITQHSAKTGEKYITETKAEYFRMFLSALGGGLIVGILCIIKVLLSKLDASQFGQAFFYSMNYSFGFVAIYILGFTLATKQPAMTAAALIKALESGSKDLTIVENKYEGFAKFFARLFRSQFIAFVGNVLMAFPISLLGIWLIDLIFDYNIAEKKWNSLITDLSPIHSMAVFHAAIAGVFLFLSGIISGSIANRDKHYQMFHRIKENPFLKQNFGKAKAEKLARWYDNKWAGIISNFWFGVFMGSTATVGLFLGLNLDIRHITFASGNLALGIYGSNYLVDHWMLFWGIFGIGIIGLVNFMVSFILSLSLAFRSRDIPFSELGSIGRSIWQHFKNKPFSFFFPVGLKLPYHEGGDNVT